MELSYLEEGIQLTKGGLSILLLSYACTSAWYYLFHTQMLSHVLSSFDAPLDMVSVIFNFSVALSLFLGIFLVDKVGKVRIIYFWAAVMPILTIWTVSTSDPSCILVLTAILGGIFGMGTLSYLTYFRSLTSPHERGRVSSIMVFTSLLASSALISLSRIFGSPLNFIIYVLLGLGILTIRFPKPKERSAMIVEEHAVQSHSRRVFLLYFIPWLICCFVNGVFSAIIQKDLFYQFAEVAPVASILQYFAAAGGSLLGGLLADWTGRRKPLAIGLVFYGTSAALSGLSSNVPVDIVFLTMAVMNGLSWGIFLTVYTLVVWGDLSSSESCAPLYAAGFIPFYLFQGIGRLVLLQPIGVSATYVSFVNSLLILISNIPLLFAPELLVREKVEEMKLNVWIRSAKKICEDHKS